MVDLLADLTVQMSVLQKGTLTGNWKVDQTAGLSEKLVQLMVQKLGEWSADWTAE